MCARVFFFWFPSDWRYSTPFPTFTNSLPSFMVTSYREPYTITECFHTFCKSCIFTTFHLKYLKCPVCKISLEPDPYKVVISDRTMQELVLKLFPQLQQLDEEQERLFYESRGIQRKKLKKLEGAHHHELHQQQQQQQQPRTNISRRSKWNSSNHGINTSFQNHKRPNTYLSSLSQEETNLNNTPLTMQQSNRNSSSSSKYYLSNEKALLVDEILFLLLPHKYQEGYRHLPPLRNQVIRTSGRLKIRLLRKYIYNNLIALDQSLSEINPSLVRKQTKIRFFLKKIASFLKKVFFFFFKSCVHLF